MTRFLPARIERLAFLRIAAPLAILGFLSSRIAHAAEWIGDEGFAEPDFGGADIHQPLYIPRLSATLAKLLAALLVASGLATSLGCEFRKASALFAGLLAYVALADRLSAFTVTKLGTVLMVALSFTAAGQRYSFDEWLKKYPPAKERNTLVAGGEVLFFQLLVVVFYTSSGIAKARGDWLRHPYVLWTHLHDSYQTWFAYELANLLPAPLWTVLQALTLVYELLAPLWFFWSKTRGLALAWGIAMHVTIGLLFGPVVWFSLLMTILLVGCFLPEAWLTGGFERALRAVPRRWMLHRDR